MKGKPEDIIQEDPQLRCLLSLCETKTGPIKSIHWITKLDDLHHTEPRKLEELSDSESDAVGDLAVTAGFIQSLWESLIIELDALKDDLVLSDFVVPIDNLLEPDVAVCALVALDKYITNKAGAEIGLLYGSLSEEALAAVQAQFAETQHIE
ncbi:hypothetical protein BDW71DRAFT_212268 [Aspergillus fruticulosus]